MTTASKITLARVALIPVFLFFALTEYSYSKTTALVIFAAASLTDGVDGYIARRYNQVTDFGKFIDPLADKLLVVAAILVFVESGQMPGWAAFLVITREFAVTALRLVAVEGGLVIAAGTSGKIKTAVSIVAICVMLTPLSGNPVFGGNITVNTLCIWLIVAATLWSGAEYFIKNGALLDYRK